MGQVEKSIIKSGLKFKDINEYLQALIEEYKTQDNGGTAYPIYVTVQELVSIGVIADGYSVNCPFGDGVTRIEYKHDSYEETFDNKQELLDLCWEECENERVHKSNYIYHFEKEIEEINVGYIWTPVEFFLTIKGAEEYIKANKHNHGELRTYVNYFERRNFEMRKLLKIFGFKTGGNDE